MITEIAQAKLNLTLQVIGRRPDGYHELVSLVAFADAGDILCYDPFAPFALETDGTFAARIDGENLIAKACRLVLEADSGLSLGRIRLTKNLPVAAGLGGGSADAAAFLRALARVTPGLAERVDLPAIAQRLGADVPVCFAQRPALMWGIGDRVADIPPLPEFWVVLVNPGVPLPTAAVFRALGARPHKGADLDRSAATPEAPGPFASLEALVGHMRRVGNDLQATGLRLCPAIAPVLGALSSQTRCLHAAQSGSGPTCFGVFTDETEARLAAASIATAHPEWWVVAARINTGRTIP